MEMFWERVWSAARDALDLFLLVAQKNAQVSQGNLVDWRHFPHHPGSSHCLRLGVANGATAAAAVVETSRA